MLIANLDKVENNNKTDVITFAFAFDLVFLISSVFSGFTFFCLSYLLDPDPGGLP